MNSQTIDKTPEGGDERDFLEFVCRYLDDQLTSRELVEFNEQLRTNDAYRETFVRYCLQGKLLAEALVTGIPLADASPIAEKELPAPTPAESSIPTFTFLGNTSQGMVGYFSSGWPVAYLIATVIFGVGLLIGSWVTVSNPQQIAEQSSRRGNSVVEPKLEPVGRITGMVDCSFDGSSDISRSKTQDPRPKTPVFLGDKFALASGLMEITYDTGARVILQGPVTYEAESAAGGYLSIGKLTARVERTKSEGPRPKTQDPRPESDGIHHSSFITHPLFAVRTPTAIVTDLGTEFGVEVARSGETTSHVFRGSVEVQYLSARGEPEGESRVLHENQSVSVEKGDGQPRIVVVRDAKPAEFIREIPRHPIKVLDLVDVVAGGDGFSSRRNRGINPTNGQVVNARWKPPLDGSTSPMTSDGQYHRVAAIPYIDGVFIPDGRRAAMQVDSAGHLFDGFQGLVKDNATWQHVWAGGAMNDMGPGYTVPTEMGGVDYGALPHGVLILEPNIGVTFDLEAIRRANPGHQLLRFRVMTGVVEISPTVAPSGCADMWVLMDGRIRCRRHEINPQSGVIPATVPIGKEDRFLTLACTDSGGGIFGNYFPIFGDPRLELSVNAGSTQDAGGN